MVGGCCKFGPRWLDGWVWPGAAFVMLTFSAPPAPASSRAGVRYVLLQGRSRTSCSAGLIGCTHLPRGRRRTSSKLWRPRLVAAGIPAASIRPACGHDAHGGEVSQPPGGGQFACGPSVFLATTSAAYLLRISTPQASAAAFLQRKCSRRPAVAGEAQLPPIILRSTDTQAPSPPAEPLPAVPSSGLHHQQPSAVCSTVPV